MRSAVPGAPAQALTRPVPLTAADTATGATAPTSRAHTEIERLSRRIAAQLRLAHAEGGLSPGQLDDLRCRLYGLHTVLCLHFRQEEESYFSLAQ